MRSLLLALVVVLGCPSRVPQRDSNPPVVEEGLSDSIDLYLWDGVQVVAEPAPQYVKDASALLGLKFNLTRSTENVIITDLVDTKEVVQGKLLLRTDCLKIIRSSRRRIILAHEIGHALGLRHHFGENNVMNPVVGEKNTVMTEEQRKFIKKNAYILSRCADKKKLEASLKAEQ